MTSLIITKLRVFNYSQELDAMKAGMTAIVAADERQVGESDGDDE